MEEEIGAESPQAQRTLLTVASHEERLMGLHRNLYGLGFRV